MIGEQSINKYGFVNTFYLFYNKLKEQYHPEEIKMDFSKMNGYEFEDFIANLLRQKGFKVTQTDYSNDGGVDLIAEYFKPLFSGKYIVQCKNYTNNLVGQPELRDLYGVVMSEKANKGILITNSDFTTQAKNFAKDKNLELINGSVLNSLIEGVDIKVKEPQLKFYEISEFDKNTYDFLKKRLKAGKKNEKNYDNLITLLESYILNGKVDICKAGLIDEIKKIVQEKRINTNKDYVYSKNSLRYFSMKQLEKHHKKWICDDDFVLTYVEGNLAETTEELLNFNDFYFSKFPLFLSFYYNLIKSDSEYDGRHFEKMTFYKKDPRAKNYKIPSFLSSYDTNRLNLLYEELFLSPIIINSSKLIDFTQEIGFDLSKLANLYDLEQKEFRSYRIIKGFFEGLAKVDSPLFGYSHKLMLYSAYKQIGFEKGCFEITKNILNPKLIEDFIYKSTTFSKERKKHIQEFFELEIKSYNEFLNGYFDNIFNPIWHDKYYKKSDQEIISEIKEVFKRHNIDVD